MREFGPLSFQGRISRRDYWIATARAAFFLLISWVIEHKVLAEFWGAYGEVYPWMVAHDSIFGKLVFGVLSVAGLGAWVICGWLSLAAVVKRLHDRNLSWRLSLLYPSLILITFFEDIFGLITRIDALPGLAYISSIIVFLLLGLAKGKKGPNRFGDDPLDVADMRIAQR